MKETPKRFSQLLSEEISNPSPRGENVLSMRERLRHFVGSMRRKFGWSLPNPGVIAREDVQQQEKDTIDDIIVTLMARYRQQLMSSHVTERAAYRVLNQVRDWAKRKYLEGNRFVHAEEKDVESYAPMVFHVSAENKLEDFERLYSLGVIDMVEYYLLFAIYHGETASYAAQLINMQEATARKTLERARTKVQEHIEDLSRSEGAPVVPKASQDKRLRNVDENLLMNAIRHILGRSF